MPFPINVFINYRKNVLHDAHYIYNNSLLWLIEGGTWAVHPPVLLLYGLTGHMKRGCLIAHRVFGGVKHLAYGEKYEFLFS